MFFLLFPFPSIILKPLDGAIHSRHLYWGGWTVAEHEALGWGQGEEGITHGASWGWMPKSEWDEEGIP